MGLFEPSTVVSSTRVGYFSGAEDNRQAPRFRDRRRVDTSSMTIVCYKVPSLSFRMLAFDITISGLVNPKYLVPLVAMYPQGLLSTLNSPPSISGSLIFAVSCGKVSFELK